MRLLHVTPALPPTPDGVGTYASAIARALAARGIESDFLAARGLPARTAEDLASALAAWRGGAGDGAAVLLHYSGYGYQARGCPTWLVDGLERWLPRSGARLATFFHEVYASGPPWRSSFWLSPLQCRLAARLAAASDALATSLPLYAVRIGRVRPGTEVAVLPVPSTLGEPERVPPLARRAPRLVVFGAAGNRLRAYGPHLPVLEAACRALGVREVVDAGPPAGLPVERVAGLPLVRLGQLPDAEASALLLDSLAGFCSYAPAFLPKSTVFAAYCAHGLLPVAAATARAAARPALVAGEHFWTPPAPGGGPLPPTALQAVADGARRWYAGHSLSRQADLFQGLLGAWPAEAGSRRATAGGER